MSAIGTAADLDQTVILWASKFCSYLDVVHAEGGDAGDARSGDARRLQAKHGLEACFQLGYGRRHDTPTWLELMRCASL